MEDPTDQSSCSSGPAAAAARGALTPDSGSPKSAKDRISPGAVGAVSIERSTPGVTAVGPGMMSAKAGGAAVSLALSGSKEHGKAVQRVILERRELGGKKGSGEKTSAAKLAPQPLAAKAEDPKVGPLRHVVSDMLRPSGASSDAQTVDAALEIILQSMTENASSTAVQEYSVLVLYDLARTCEENRARIATAGAFPKIVAGMASAPSSTSLQERGCSVMWLLALGEERREACVLAGACEAIVEALKNHASHTAVVSAALGAIKPVSIVDFGRRRLETAGAAEAVARAMSSNASVKKIQSEGCSLLSNLAVDIAHNRVTVAGSVELDAILGAMMEHPTEVAVQKQACFVLKNLTFSERNLRSLAEHGLPVEELLEHAGENVEECKADAELVRQRLRTARDDMAEEAARKHQSEEAVPMLFAEAAPQPAPEPAAFKPHADFTLANEVQKSAMASGERGEYRSALNQLEVALKMKRELYGGPSAANDDLVYVLNCMGYLSVLCGDLPSAVSQYEDSLETQRRMPGVSPRDLAKTMTDVATLCLKTGDLVKAESYLMSALDAKRGADGSLTLDAAKDVENLADLHRAKGETDTAERLYVHAARCYKSSPLPGSDRAVAEVVTKLAALAGSSGRLDLAQGRFEMALELRRQMTPTSGASRELIEALNNLGYTRALNGNDLDAIKAYEESVVMQTDVLDTADESLANTHSTLGVLHLKTGDPTAARDNLESALIIKMDIYGEENTSPAAGFYPILSNLGEACALEEDLESAEKYYRDALRHVAHSPGEAATLLAVLGNLSSERGDYETAKDCFTKALETAKAAKTLATSGGAAAGAHPVVDLAEMLSKLGNVCSILRNYAAAIDKYESSLKMRAAQGGGRTAAESEATADTLHSLGVAQCEKGSLGVARTTLTKALEAKRRLFGEEKTPVGCVSIAETHKALGDVSVQFKDYKGAEDQYENALSALEESTKNDDVPIGTATLAAAASVKIQMGNLSGIVGDIPSAQDHYREALELRRSLCSDAAPDTNLIEALNKLGFAHLVHGENAAALDLYEESLKAQRILNGVSDAAGNEEMEGVVRTVEVLRARC